jgi:hypothetical protein
MSETVPIEERLRRFAAAPDDADWQDVLRRASLSTPRPGRARRFPRLTPRRIVVAVVVAGALALAAVSIAGSSLFGFSNPGKRVPPAPSIRRALDSQTLRRLGWQFRVDTFKLLARRQGIGLYTARTKKGDHLCYFRVQGRSFPSFDCAPYAGQFLLPQRLAGPDGGKGGVRAQTTWMRTHPFPSPTRPLMDMSALSMKGNFEQLVGLAADGVRSIQLLALSDCHPIVTVPVINNAYIDPNPTKARAAFLVARNASGKIIWHSAKSYLTSPHERVPLDRTFPRNCGLR